MYPVYYFNYGNSHLQRLLLDGLLQIDVGLVGNVQRQLQLSDLDLELLLDAGDLCLQLGLGLDHASVQLLDLDAGLLAGDQKVMSVKLQGLKVLDIQMRGGLNATVE